MKRVIPEVFDDLEIGITLHDPETGEILGVNERLEDLYGYTAAELREMDVADYSVDDQRFTQAAAERRIRAAAAGEPQTFEWHVERSDGDRVWVRVRLASTTLDGMECVVAEIRDITERKQREQELALRDRAIAAAPVGITISDPEQEDNPLVYVNERFEEMTGYDAADALGRNCRFLQGENTDPEPVVAIREAIDAAEPVTVELRNYRKDGEDFWNRVSIGPVRDDENNVTNFVGFQQDVTRRKEYEDKLERSNERLQQFAYILSHDLQEPLRMVASYVDLLEAELDEELDEETSEYMEYAADGADRMQAMIDDLLRYSRVGTRGGDFVETDVASVLEDVLRDLEFTLEETGIEVVVDDLPTVRADASQLGQLFQNLLKNAADHGGEGTTVEITAEETAGGYEFVVSDDGPGIPEDQQDAIFDIFEKDRDSDGTGIGLAVCERIVNRHDGAIRVESTPGEGTTFYFSLDPPTGA